MKTRSVIAASVGISQRQTDRDSRDNTQLSTVSKRYRSRLLRSTAPCCRLFAYNRDAHSAAKRQSGRSNYRSMVEMYAIEIPAIIPILDVKVAVYARDLSLNPRNKLLGVVICRRLRVGIGRYRLRRLNALRRRGRHLVSRRIGNRQGNCLLLGSRRLRFGRRRCVKVEVAVANCRVRRRSVVAVAFPLVDEASTNLSEVTTKLPAKAPAPAVKPTGIRMTHRAPLQPTRRQVTNRCLRSFDQLRQI